MNVYAYVKNVNRFVDIWELSFKSWIVDEKIDFNNVSVFVKDKKLTNIFNPDIDRFPNGRFNYEHSDKKFNHVIPGHGIDLEMLEKIPNSNSALSPTISIARKSISGGSSKNLMTDAS